MERTDVAMQLLSAPIGLQFLDLVSHSGGRSLSDLELLALAEQAQVEMSIYVADYEYRLNQLVASRGRLTEWARWVVERAEHWWQSLDRSRQAWLGGANEPGASNLEVDLDSFSAEVPKPRTGLWTSTLVSLRESAWMQSSEVNEAPAVYGQQVLWNLTVSQGARIYEVNSPIAWANLARYGDGVSGYRWIRDGRRSLAAVRRDPDWRSVAESWDAVHLSLGGLLTSHDVPITSGGLTTELRGWNVESTVWLRWCFTSAVAIGE